MTNIDFSNQQALIDSNELAIPTNITIIGTGGFGGWIAIFAAKAGVAEISLVNHSGRANGKSRDVEGREISVGPFEDSHLGEAKVDALEELILRTNPNTKVSKHKITFDPSSNLDLVKGVVFNGVSNQRVHMGIWEVCMVNKIPCFSGVYNGISFGSLIESPFGLEIGGDLPVWVGSAVLSAALTFHSACVEPLAYFGNGSDITKSSIDMSKILGDGSAGDL